MTKKEILKLLDKEVGLFAESWNEDDDLLLDFKKSEKILEELNRLR